MTPPTSPGRRAPRGQVRASSLPSALVRSVSLAALVLSACGTPPVSPPPPPPSPLGNPPASPINRELPTEIASRLDRTPGGLPILTSSTESDPSKRVHLAYDATLADPIVNWGECLSRVLACKRTNPGGPIAGCVSTLPRCAADTGGARCCPAPCFAAFEANLAAGMGEKQAVDRSFVAGTCIAGFEAFKAASGVSP